MDSRRPLRCIVKLGGAAITCKDKFETMNEDTLSRTSLQLRRAMGGAHFTLDWTDSKVPPIGLGDHFAEMKALIVVHGAGSFGHFQATAGGVSHGGLESASVTAGFVATRISVIKLHHQVVKALASEGIPVVGMSPFAAGWSTHGRQLVCDGVAEVKRAVNAGFVPVLHGDAVLDTLQGCTILSGDVIIRRLAEELQPDYVVFLTNVPGVFDRPPSEEGAVLLQEIVVYENGEQAIVKPKLDGQVKTRASSHDSTGGMATKIAEAACIAQLGIPVYIAEAGTDNALQALTGAVMHNWVGTLVRRA